MIINREFNGADVLMFTFYIREDTVLEGVETSEHGTLTVPIEVEHEGTQTEESLGESVSDSGVGGANALIKLTEDRATSPINSKNEKQLFEELEQITGHIIIQKFITRTEEEFQQLIKIRFPGMQVRESKRTNSIPLFPEFETEDAEAEAQIPNPEDKGRKEFSSTNPPEESLEEFSSNLKHEERKVASLDGTIEDKNTLGREELSELSPDKDELLNIVAMNAFEESLDILGKDLDSDVDENSAEIKEIVMSPFSLTKNTEEVHPISFSESEELSSTNPEVGQSESKVDANEITSDDIPIPRDPQTIEVKEEEEKVESETETEDVASSTCYNSVIQTFNDLGRKEEDTGSETSGPGARDALDGAHSHTNVAGIASNKSVATQTEGSFTRGEKRNLRRPHRRGLDSAQSSSSSSTASLLDLQVRVQKLDVRLRVGGKRREPLGSSSTIQLTDHLELLQVKGEKIKIKEETRDLRSFE